MAVLKQDFGEMLTSKPVEVTLKGAKGLGKVKYNFHEAVKEIVNNFLVNKMFVNKYGRLVKGQVIIDTTNKKLYVIDDMSGFDEFKMMQTMDLGCSLPTDAIMSAHGLGLKSLIPYFGQLDEIRSSRDGNDYFSMIPNVSGSVMAHDVLKSNEPLKMYSVDKESWEKMSGCGSMLIIDLDPGHIFVDSRKPKNLVQVLEHSYSQYLGETLELDVIWIENNQVKYHSKCRRHTPLLSAERVVQDDVINPKTNMPYEHIDKSKTIGPDLWEVNEYYDCPETGIVVKVKVGFVPHPKNVAKHFEESKDDKYNPNSYKENIYIYGNKFKGISYSVQDVPISGGSFSMDRKDGIYGTLDIVKGIETTKTKNGIVRTEYVDIFEEGLQEFFRNRGILIRSTASNLRIDEDEMENKLLERYAKSSKLRQYLGMNDKNFTFTNQYQGMTCGKPDIVFLENLNVKQIQEIKKEGGRDLWKALAQGLSYGMEKDVRDIVLIAQDIQLPTDIQIKVDIFNAKGWNIRYEQYQNLTSQTLFPND